MKSRRIACSCRAHTPAGVFVRENWQSARAVRLHALEHRPDQLPGHVRSAWQFLELQAKDLKKLSRSYKWQATRKNFRQSSRERLGDSSGQTRRHSPKPSTIPQRPLRSNVFRIEFSVSVLSTGEVIGHKSGAQRRGVCSVINYIPNDAECSCISMVIVFHLVAAVMSRFSCHSPRRASGKK
jgi:hypothetical protein